MTSHLHREIEKLKKKLLALSAVVEENVPRAVKSLFERDQEIAAEVCRVDEEQVNPGEVEVEEDCLKILALHQPVATDLRFIISVLKINNDLERVGDMAVNIAERADFLSRAMPVQAPPRIREMSDKAHSMLKRSVDALVGMDAEIARAVCAEDDEIDEMNRQNYAEVQDRVRAHPEQLEYLMHILAVSRHLERIADHATNIAEDVIYMVTGEIIRHKAADYKSQF